MNAKLIALVMILTAGACSRESHPIISVPATHKAGMRATFENPSGDQIILSTESITIGGSTISSVDCSTADNFCKIFGDLFALIVPKACKNFSSVTAPHPWKAGNYTAGIISVVPHLWDTEMLSNVSDKFTYVIDQQEGVTSLTYDPEGRLGRSERKEMSWDKRGPLTYNRISGHIGDECHGPL